MGKTIDIAEGNRQHIEGAVMDNDDVLSYWCALTTDVSDVDATVVLEMLVKLWITM